MAVERLLPSPEAEELLDLVGQVCREKIAPGAAAAEAAGEFGGETLKLLGELGLIACPFAERLGGLEQPYEVYLQALEEVAAARMSIGVGLSVQVMTATVLAEHGTDEQLGRWLPAVLSGARLGAYALSEPQAGSDISAISTQAVRSDSGYRLTGAKAWITHGGVADHYLTFARTSQERRHGLSCFWIPADSSGLSFGRPERKLGLTGSPTAAVQFEDTPADQEQRLGAEGDGMRIALAALDRGRLGIAACATGLAQAALDVAVAYAAERVQFGRRIADFQGLQFLLAELAAAVTAARATYVHAARLLDRGRDFAAASATAKLIATDTAMRVTTDAIQVLGGYGYTSDFEVERYFREAKVTQIFEGTNQIQRLVIARSLLRPHERPG